MRQTLFYQKDWLLLFLLLVEVETHQFSKIMGLKGATNEPITKFFAFKKSTESTPIKIAYYDFPKLLTIKTVL